MIQKAVYHFRIKEHMSKSWETFLDVAIEHESMVLV